MNRFHCLNCNYSYGIYNWCVHKVLLCITGKYCMVKTIVYTLHYDLTLYNNSPE